MKHLHFEERSEEETKKFEDEFSSRPEYKAGEAPFEYQYVFSSGESLKAFQDEEGVGHVVIQRDGKTVFDFSSFLPPDFLFVTPTYFKKFPEKRDYLEPDGWAVNIDRGLVFLGDFKSPKDILSLLHEIGHMQFDIPEDREERKRILQGSPDDDFTVLPRAVSSEKKLAQIQSKMERRAWAWTLRTIRSVQRDTGINPLEIFPTFLDLKKYIDGCLATYRRSHEWVIKNGHDESFYAEMEKLFDRWKYSSVAKE